MKMPHVAEHLLGGPFWFNTKLETYNLDFFVNWLS